MTPLFSRMTPLFVYGTLLPGSTNALSRALWEAAEDLGPATVPGRLYDLGQYPAFLDLPQSPSVSEGLSPAPAPLVHGRLARLYRDSDLDLFDDYEDDEFQRDLRTATLPDGSTVLAWVYVYQAALDEALLIPSGRWPLQ